MGLSTARETQTHLLESALGEPEADGAQARCSLEFPVRQDSEARVEAAGRLGRYREAKSRSREYCKIERAKFCLVKSDSNSTRM